MPVRARICEVGRVNQRCVGVGSQQDRPLLGRECRRRVNTDLGVAGARGSNSAVVDIPNAQRRLSSLEAFSLTVQSRLLRSAGCAVVQPCHLPFREVGSATAGTPQKAAVVVRRP